MKKTGIALVVLMIVLADCGGTHAQKLAPESAPVTGLIDDGVGFFERVDLVAYCPLGKSEGHTGSPARCFSFACIWQGH